jgi:surface-adhesin protein E
MMVLVLWHSRQAHAEWVAFGNSDSGTIAYVDTGSIQPEGNRVTMWVLYDFKTMHTAVGGPFLSSKALNEYDCATARQRMLMYSRFSGNMGKGSVVYGESHDERWAQVTPKSLGQLLWTFACSKG